MRVLGVPSLTGGPRRRLVHFTAVILPAAAETVGGEAGALALPGNHSLGDGWEEGEMTGKEIIYN